MWLVPPVIDAPRYVEVASVAAAGDASAVVSFAEVEDASVADMLVGCHCLVSKSDLGSTDVSPVLADLSSGTCAGWRFMDETSRRAGEIVSVEEIGGQAMLTVVLDDDASEDGHLVPLVDELVVDEDAREKRLSMACPQGLFDL